MPIKKVTIRIAAANAWKTGYWEKFDSGVQSEHPVPESAPKKTAKSAFGIQLVSTRFYKNKQAEHKINDP